MAESSNIKNKNNLIFFDNLTVILRTDGEYWLAQSLEINYFAYAKTIAKAKENFKIGLIETIKANFKAYGNITSLLKWAPPHVLDIYHAGNYVKNGDVEVNEPVVPIGNLRFMKPTN